MNASERAGAGGTAALWAGVLLLAGALLLSPLRGHVDDSDAQLYQVLARHLALGHRWLEPGPMPGSLRPFREHLPFGLWPLAATDRLFGEGALPLTPVLCSLATVALVLWLGTRLAGARAGAAAALLLATNETFFMYGARPRLDPLLVLLSLCAAAPALLGPLRGRSLWLAALAGGLAALVKGPFGLVPLGAAGLARALVMPSRRDPGTEAHARPGMGGGPARASVDASDARLRGLLAVALALWLAALPLLAFLLWDRAHGATWWSGFVVDQLLASARGLRPDGSTSPLFPLQSIAGRFWPGLPFALLGLVQAVLALLPPRPRLARLGVTSLLRGPSRACPEVTLLAVTSLLAIALLSLPTRKVWNHELVVYPSLALLGGLALDGLLERAPRRFLQLTLATLTLLALLFSALGLGARILPAPCVMSSEFASRLDSLAPGTPILLVSPHPEWTTLQALAAERRLSPWAATSLPAEPALAAAAAPEDAVPARALEARRAHTAMLLDDDGATVIPAPWQVEARARGWALLRR